LTLSKAEQKSVVLAEILREIERIEATTIAAVLEKGKRYHKITTEKLYYPEYKSFRQFTTKGTSVGYGTAYNYINLYLAFGDDKDVLRVQGETRLIRALPYLKNDVKQFDKEKVKDWLHKAITLSKQDYDDCLREASGKKTKLMGECEHKEIKNIKISQCKECGKKLSCDVE